MKTFRAVAAAALLGALVGCGSPVSGSPTPAPPPAAPPTTAPPTTAAPVDPAAARAEIETAFRGYYEALRVEDFAGACAFHADETTQRMLAELARRGVSASTCEEGLSAVYAVPGNAESVEAVAASATIVDVTVTGDDATITWSADINGARETTTSALRRIDGTWRLVRPQT